MTDREILIQYMLMKVRQEDWHGVSDAANDLREMDARGNDMSDTPRTDVAQHNMGSIVEPHYVVDADFSRDLERELAEAQAEIVRLKACALVCERKIYDPAGFYQIVMAAAAKIRKGE